MKVSIITRHAIANYGSLLQALALQHSIEQLGFEAEIVDYIREDEDYRNITKTLVEKSVFWNRNIFTRSIYHIIQKPLYLRTGYKFRKMQKKYLNLSRRTYRSLQDLKESAPSGDIYCTGSDQVWGMIGRDKYDRAYFLDYVNNKDAKCITYAASFGKANFTDDILNAYKKLLSKYSNFLVRENTAKQIINHLGFSTCHQVLDPTLLVSAEEWTRMLGLKTIDEEYLLIYQLHKNLEMDKYARLVAKRYGLKLIRVSPSLHHILRGGKFRFLPELAVFLDYIKNARYMITDSFHGTAFAINFNVQFIDIYPGVTSTRNQSILQLFNLENRVITEYTNYNCFDDKIDYKLVNKKLECERNISLEFLKHTIIG